MEENDEAEDNVNEASFEGGKTGSGTAVSIRIDQDIWNRGKFLGSGSFGEVCLLATKYEDWLLTAKCCNAKCRLLLCMFLQMSQIRVQFCNQL